MKKTLAILLIIAILARLATRFGGRQHPNLSERNLWLFYRLYKRLDADGQ